MNEIKCSECSCERLEAGADIKHEARMRYMHRERGLRGISFRALRGGQEISVGMCRQSKSLERSFEAIAGEHRRKATGSLCQAEGMEQRCDAKFVMNECAAIGCRSCPNGNSLPTKNVTNVPASSAGIAFPFAIMKNQPDGKGIAMVWRVSLCWLLERDRLSKLAVERSGADIIKEAH